MAESIVKEKKTGAPYHPVENPIGTWRNHPETECEEAIQYYVGIAWSTEKAQTHEHNKVSQNDLQIDAKHAVRLNNSMSMPNDAGAGFDVIATEGRIDPRAMVANSKAAEEQAKKEREQQAKAQAEQAKKEAREEKLQREKQEREANTQFSAIQM